ncbi:MAG: TatD family hydrolase [Patescibacteria group bacterium]
MKLIDAHAHLPFPQFAGDREEVIARARAAGVGMINVGTDLEISRAAVKLAEQNDDMWATVGVHPTDLPAADTLAQTLAELEKLAKHPKAVGIGECGLDYFHVSNESERQRQAEIFNHQIELALAVNKPLMIHCRLAYQNLLAIIKIFPTVKGNVHFFAGDWATARQFLDLGFTLSFTGVITFTTDYDEVLKNMPLDRILVETDCPFVAPMPYRGKRNEPAYVERVMARLAEIKGFPSAEVAAATLANTKRTFNLAAF